MDLSKQDMYSLLLSINAVAVKVLENCLYFSARMGILQDKKQELKNAKQNVELQEMRQESLADELFNVQTQIVREKLVLSRVEEDAIATGNALADLSHVEEKVKEDAVILTAELTELQSNVRILEDKESELRRR